METVLIELQFFILKEGETLLHADVTGLTSYPHGQLIFKYSTPQPTHG